MPNMAHIRIPSIDQLLVTTYWAKHWRYWKLVFLYGLPYTPKLTTYYCLHPITSLLLSRARLDLSFVTSGYNLNVFQLKIDKNGKNSFLSAHYYYRQTMLHSIHMYIRKAIISKNLDEKLLKKNTDINVKIAYNWRYIHKFLYSRENFDWIFHRHKHCFNLKFYLSLKRINLSYYDILIVILNK